MILKEIVEKLSGLEHNKEIVLRRGGVPCISVCRRRELPVSYSTKEGVDKWPINPRKYELKDSYNVIQGPGFKVLFFSGRKVERCVSVFSTLLAATKNLK